VFKVTLILIIMLEACARLRGDLRGQYTDLDFTDRWEFNSRELR